MTENKYTRSCTKKFVKEFLQTELDIREKRLDTLYKQGRASPQELKLGKAHLQAERKSLEKRK